MKKQKNKLFSLDALELLQDGIGRLEQYQKDARRVVIIPKKVGEQTKVEPVFANDLIKELYFHDMRIDPALISAILALDKESLIGDLHKVIYDSVLRFEYFTKETKWTESSHDFLLHAIFLLTELKDENNLQVVLDLLRQDDEYVDYWFSDYLTEGIWETIYVLGFNKLEELSSFLKEPNRYCYCRSEISVAVVQMALHHPNRRAEIIGWYKDLLSFFLNHKDDNNLIDSDMIGLMVSDILDMQGNELIPEITSIYKNKLAGIGIAGNLEHVLNELNTPELFRYQTRKVSDIFSRYEEIISTWSGYTDTEQPILEEESSSYDILNQFTALKASKPGRNDPCPCGSGKKYKKCCMHNELGFIGNH